MSKDNFFIKKVKRQILSINDSIESYFEKFRSIYKKEQLVLNNSCLKELCCYDWPGNIREIKNCMEFMVNSAEEVSVTLSSLMISPLSNSTFLTCLSL